MKCVIYFVLFLQIFISSFVASSEVLHTIRYPTQKKSENLTIGGSIARTGDSTFSQIGQEILNCIDMWVWWVNEIHGGIQVGGKNYLVEFKWMDNNGNAALAQNITEYLLSEEGVQVIFGPYSSTLTEPVINITESRKVVMMVAGAASTSLFEGRQFLFSPLSPDSGLMTTALKSLVLRGARTVVNIVQNLMYTENLGNSVRTQVTSMKKYTKGLKIIYDASLPPSPTQSQVDSLIFNLSQTVQNPDILLGCVYFDVCSMILVAVKKLDYHPSAMLFSLCVDDAEYLDTVGAQDGRYILGATQWSKVSNYTDEITGWTTSTFIDLYQQRYKNQPCPASAAASYFAAGLSLTRALELAGSISSISVGYALRRLSLNSFYGKIQFDSNGQNTQDYLYIQYNSNDELQIVIPDTLATGPLIYPMPSFSHQSCILQYGNTSCECWVGGCPKCTFNDFWFNVSECNQNTVERKVSFYLISECQSQQEMSPRSFSIPCDYVPFASTTGKVVQVLACVGGILGLFFLGWTLLNFKTKVVKASQPEFCALVAVGGAVCATSPLLTLGPQSSKTCWAHPWMFYLSFSLMMGSLFVKTFRIWRIFSHHKLVRMKFTALDSFKILSVVMGVIIILLAIWSITDTPRLVAVPYPIASFGTTRNFSCSTNPILVTLLVFSEVALVIAACYFSFKNRKVPDKFSETQYILLSVYSIAFLFGVAIIVTVQSTNASMSVLMRGIGASVSCTVAMVSLFVPKIWMCHFTKSLAPNNESLEVNLQPHLQVQGTNRKLNTKHYDERGSESLQKTVDKYQKLVQFLNSRLPENDRVEFENFVTTV